MQLGDLIPERQHASHPSGASLLPGFPPADGADFHAEELRKPLLAHLLPRAELSKPWPFVHPFALSITGPGGVEPQRVL